MASSSHPVIVWGTAALLTLGLHYAWEMVQGRLFATFRGTMFSPSHRVTVCFLGSCGDLLISATTYLIMAAIFRRLYWALEPGWLWPAIMWVALGVLISIGVELRAVATQWWTYAPTMPTIMRIGVLPLLQWIIVPWASLLGFRWIFAPN